MALLKLDLYYQRFLKESQWLLDEFNRELEQLRWARIETISFSLLPEMATLRLHDEWARFCRNLVLSSAADRPFTANGTRLEKPPGIKRRADAVNASIKSTGRKFEPRWATASESLKAAQRIGINNLATVSAALGAVNSPAEDLRHVRNFFAHRAEDTANKIRTLGFFASGMNLNATSLLAPTIAGGTTRFESWVLGLRAVASAAIQ